MTIADHDRIPETARDWQRAGKGAALATVVETWVDPFFRCASQKIGAADFATDLSTASPNGPLTSSMAASLVMGEFIDYWPGLSGKRRPRRKPSNLPPTPR